MEVLKMRQEEERKDDDELCLELSIGFGKRYRKSISDDDSRSSAGFCISNGEDNLKIREREKEKDGFAEEELQSERKKKKKKKKILGYNNNYCNCQQQVAEGLNLNLSLLHRCSCLYPEVQHGNAGGGVDSSSSTSSVVISQTESVHKTASYGSLERSGSASDYQTTAAHKGGGSSSDTGSQSSRLWSRQQGHNVAKPDQKSWQHLTRLSEHDTKVSPPIPGQTNARQHPSNEQSSSSVIEKPPKPPSPVAPNQSMPCVTATGNGPNGKTVTGFLYKYINTEVIIMCVCHRRFFTPAEFVEHAGGVDISHPLRHITVVPFRSVA
ncbi:ninja-family protein 3-like isoform X1 [Andrographis paniculata]|uniref:ninja-family protein 3-like isoform X1 n=1 Tax=Andrographis paniculata TaxID=175694 RepID=UPI0021E88FD5|nr:ninja-family protein 3-like isoform X1 [Andrographis paniculata]